MRWRRRRQQPAPSPDAARRIGEAKAAREHSEERLEQVRERWPEVNEVTTSLRRLRERNHFADLIARAMGDGRDPHPG